MILYTQHLNDSMPSTEIADLEKQKGCKLFVLFIKQFLVPLLAIKKKKQNKPKMPYSPEVTMSELDAQSSSQSQTLCKKS